VVLGNGGAEAIFVSRNLKNKIMKKIFLSILCSLFCCAVLNAQTAKWFAGIATGYPIGGPSSSLKSDMKDQGFDQMGSFDILGSGDYPVAVYIPPLLIMAGRQISEFGSLYMIAGQAASAKVEGYNGNDLVNVHFSVLQTTLGYQFTLRNSHTKLGIGPSLFIFKYYPDNYGQPPVPTVSETRPGGSFMMRLPFGQEKKLFGVELFFEMNMAPSAHVADVHESVNGGDVVLHGGSVSMVFALLGLNFVFRG
jgi:hypothetical protein